MADTTFRTVLPDLKAVDNGDGTYSVAVSVENLPYDPLTVLRTGEYYSTGLPDMAQTQALTADRLDAIPFFVARDMTVDRIAIEVTALDAGKFARIGIYNNGTNLYPGTLVVDGGAVSVGANALVAATIAESLTKGLYWLALVSDGTATLRSANTTPHVLSITGTLGSNLYYTRRLWRVTQVYGALPDPYTAGGALQWNVEAWAIALRVLSLD